MQTCRNARRYAHNVNSIRGFAFYLCCETAFNTPDGKDVGESEKTVGAAVPSAAVNPDNKASDT